MRSHTTIQDDSRDGIAYRLWGRGHLMSCNGSSPPRK